MRGSHDRRSARKRLHLASEASSSLFGDLVVIEHDESGCRTATSKPHEGARKLAPEYQSMLIATFTPRSTTALMSRLLVPFFIAWFDRPIPNKRPVGQRVSTNCRNGSDRRRIERPTAFGALIRRGT